MSEFMRKYGDGWSFSDPAGRVESVLSVIPHKGEWIAIETCPAGEPDDDDLPARIIARLAADNARLTRELSEASHARDAYKVIADGREGIEEFSHMKSEEIETLAARVAYLEHENARLNSEIIRVEGELAALLSPNAGRGSR